MTNLLRWPGYIHTLIAMLLAIGVGLAFGSRAAFLGPIAHWIIFIIKTLAIPLIFFAILDTILQKALKGRGVAALFLVSIINGLCAITIALLLSNAFHPGQYLPLAAQGDVVGGQREELTFARLFVMGIESPSVLAILFAVTLGLSSLFFLKGPTFSTVHGWVQKSLAVVLKLMGWVVHLVPLAVFASVAQVIGKVGFSFVGGLGAYLFFCLFGMFLHVMLVYQSWIRGVAGMPLKKFWKEALEPMLHGFGINSSLATLPVTLRALQRLGVSNSSARLSACVGTNFNNDGILLYEVVAVLFLAQAYGQHLSLPTQLASALICVVACIGVSGIPEAGVIALSLVLPAMHIPMEHVPVLLTVDWVVARTRSAVNVLGDITVAIGIDALTTNKLDA